VRIGTSRIPACATSSLSNGSRCSGATSGRSVRCTVERSRFCRRTSKDVDRRREVRGRLDLTLILSKALLLADESGSLPRFRAQIEAG
jgi:hypothetical protein